MVKAVALHPANSGFIPTVTHRYTDQHVMLVNQSRMEVLLSTFDRDLISFMSSVSLT